MAKFPLFVNGAYRALSPTADDEQCINWYPERLKPEAPGAVTEMALYPTPGARQFAEVTEAVGGRAAFAMDGRCFFVIGSKLVEVTTTGTYVIHGDVGNDGQPAQMSSNGIGGNQLVVSSNDQLFCLDLLTNVLTLVLTSGSNMCGMSYGFFESFNRTDSQFQISAEFDGQTWDALDFAGRSIAPDPWLAMLVTSYGETWLLGEQSTEVWYNNGADDFPYAPDQSGLIPYGIAAAFSLCEAFDRVVWLATTKDGDLQVVAAQGFTPKRISDLALEAELDTYDTVSDAEGETYRQGGHTFYKLTFPTENKTWVYDFQTNLWHRRGTWISEMNAYDEWRPTWHAFFDRKHLWCERGSGKILEVSPEFFVDAGDRELRRVRRSPTVRDQNKPLIHKRLEVLIEAGIGDVENPLMMLRFSDDGGKTWGNELTQPMGNLGHYQQRLVWEKLGQSEARTYELSCSEAMAVRVIDAFIEVG